MINLDRVRDVGKEYAPLELDVEGLPRRTAHAMHALIESTRELNMPVTAAEAMLYDEEALSPGSTGRALAHAQHLGLAVHVDRYWLPSYRGLAHRSEFEDRFLRDTERDGKD